jgi:hypothetical protein
MNDSTNDTASGVAAAKIGHLREPGPEYQPLKILIGRYHDGRSRRCASTGVCRMRGPSTSSAG